jgi:hypothetical protein
MCVATPCVRLPDESVICPSAATKTIEGVWEFPCPEAIRNVARPKPDRGAVRTSPPLRIFDTDIPEHPIEFYDNRIFGQWETTV